MANSTELGLVYNLLLLFLLLLTILLLRPARALNNRPKQIALLRLAVILNPVNALATGIGLL